MNSCSPSGSAALERWRSLFPITERHVYLRNGNIAPAATPVLEAVRDFSRLWAEDGDACWPIGITAFEEAKRLFAALIGSSSDNICSVPNTSTGINLAAQIIRPKAGSNVVVHELTHMSNVYPWLRLKSAGVELRYAKAEGYEVPTEEFERLADENTAAIDVSHVSMMTGARIDLAALSDLCAKNGAALVVDAAQSCGAVEIDVVRTPVDFLVVPAFKWLLGPLGAGFVYVSPEWIERADPPMPGWFGMGDGNANDLWEMTPKPGAARFETGVPNLIGYIAACAGLAMLNDVGFRAAQERIAELWTYLDQGLHELEPLGVAVRTPRDKQKHAGLLAFDCPNHQELHARMLVRDILTGDRFGHIRADPSWFNTEDEIDQLLGEVKSFLGGVR